MFEQAGWASAQSCVRGVVMTQVRLLCLIHGFFNEDSLCWAVFGKHQYVRHILFLSVLVQMSSTSCIFPYTCLRQCCKRSEGPCHVSTIYSKKKAFSLTFSAPLTIVLLTVLTDRKYDIVKETWRSTYLAVVVTQRCRALLSVNWSH